MKRIHSYIILCLLAIGICSCNYLDIVPDEIDTEGDAFEDRTAALRYVYSCYSYLPEPRNGTSSLDLMTGDEVSTAFEHETFAAFPRGNFSASNTVISYWDNFFQGLRQCYIFLNNVDRVPGLDEATRNDYVAQIHFLIAYYHFLMARCYGPIILIREEPLLNTSPADYLGRTSYDECVSFITEMFDQAAAVLPPRRTQVAEYGLATSTAALALKAKMLLYAASPLFNGNSEYYSSFTNNEGTPMMPATYDPEKWVRARDALKEAIDFAEANGYSLYQTDNYEISSNAYPADPVQRKLRYNIIEPGNQEIIYADARNEGNYGIQNKSLPFVSAKAWNGIAPTWTMLNRFYTKNGLPYDEDPEYRNLDKLSLVTVDEEHATEAMPGRRTLRFNLDREPRFYSWIAFQGGYYEVLNASSNGGYENDTTYRDGRLVCDFVLGGNCSRGTASARRTTNYSPSGYLNKKGVSPANSVSTSLTAPQAYPWPIIRLTDLYLGYAEACVETGDLDEARTFLNSIRTRAGIPTVEDSWSGVATLDQTKLREIVRQERLIEFYLENQNFWDLRRWKTAEQYFGVRAQGLNIDATTLEEFARLTEIDFERHFTAPMQYLLPIPSGDVNRNENLVQNPGY